VKKAFAFYNNHARANAAANAVMLSQELEIRLNAMPPEAKISRFGAGTASFQLAGWLRGDEWWCAISHSLHL
jgi:hypothetical protein